MLKKLLCIFLVFSMILVLVTACTNSNPNSEETTPEETTSAETTKEEESTTEKESTSGEEIPEIEYAVLAANGTPNASIVYPAAYTNYELTSAKKLVQRVEMLCGVKLPMVDDTTPVAEGQLEILIGSTSRVESAIVEGAMGDTEHAVAMINGKLVIHGRQEGTMAYAVDQVVNAISSADGVAMLPTDFDTIGHAGLLTSELFVYDTVLFDLVRDTGDNAYLIRFKNTTVDNFVNYLQMLDNKYGFEIVDSHAILNDMDNLYTMLSDGARAVTVIYTAYNGDATVIVESAIDNGYINFRNTTASETNEAICEPLMIQVGLHPAGGSRQNGMGYIFRLSNGKFVVFDGGWNEDKFFQEGQNGRRMYETMKAYAPDPNNIQIAAWLVTHAHTDHIGGLEWFVNNCLPSDHITLETIIINLPSYELLSTPSHEKSDLPNKVEIYRQMTKKAAATGTNVCKAHAGQIYEIGDLKLEILFSYDLLYPETLWNFNNSSVSSRVTIEGQTYLFVGDSATEANIVMRNMYGEDLRCDFFQVPHHGYGPNDPGFLKLAETKWLLWPIGASSYEGTKYNDHVQLFFAAGTKVESIYVSAYQEHVFHLPFDGTNVTIVQNETLP